jgi:hypothetical protein
VQLKASVKYPAWIVKKNSGQPLSRIRHNHHSMGESHIAGQQQFSYLTVAGCKLWREMDVVSILCSQRANQNPYLLKGRTPAWGPAWVQ